MLQKDATCKWYLLYVAKVAVGSHNLFNFMKGNPITLHYPKICYSAKA